MERNIPETKILSPTSFQMSKLILDLSQLPTHTNSEPLSKIKQKKSTTYTIIAQIITYSPLDSTMTFKSLPSINDKSMTTLSVKFDDDTVWDTKSIHNSGVMRGMPVQCKIVPVINEDEDSQDDDDDHMEDYGMGYEQGETRFKCVRCIEIDIDDLDMEGFMLGLKIQQLASNN
ncbi:hypothetical protein WICPIJ_003076 [Wickerhamomyces pijperi]|uniref:Uncharacterized protein n=1 Tax=Wickerhamomyces pijperi TaxID=599730 RepID=A0A9P8TP86_WICPI|nr:hypothetical protein WICPIJ_003076 [Wickerhamomyces pijperi]